MADHLVSQMPGTLVGFTDRMDDIRSWAERPEYKGRRGMILEKVSGWKGAFSPCLALVIVPALRPNDDGLVREEPESKWRVIGADMIPD